MMLSNLMHTSIIQPLTSFNQQFALTAGIDQNHILIWLVQTTIIVSILIGLIILIRKPVARFFGPQAAYALWALPLLRFALPELAILKQPEIQSPLVNQTIQFVNIDAAQATPETTLLSPLLLQTLLFIWIGCALLWACSQLAKQNLFNKLIIENSKPAPQSIYVDLKTKLKNNHNIKIRIATNETGPLVTGLFKPVIILPKSFMEDYNEAEREMAITHEIAHIQRGDLWITFGALLFRALQWPNPIVHFAWRYFRADQETSCDAIVLQKSTQDNGTHSKTHTYASAIMKAAKNSTTGSLASTKHSLPAHTLGLPLNHELKERLMLMKSIPSPKRRLLGAATISTITLASLALTAQYGYAKQETKSEAETKKQIIVKTIGEDEKKLMITKINGDIIDTNDIDDIMTGTVDFVIKNDADNAFFIEGTDAKCNTINNAIKDKKVSTTKEGDQHEKIVKSFIIKSNDDEIQKKSVIFNPDTTFTIVCDDGALIHQSGSEIKAIESAIASLKEEEIKSVERIRETREKLEKRLEDLKKIEKELEKVKK